MHATSKRGRTGFEVSDDISEEPSMGSYIQHQLFNKMPAWIHLLFHQGMTSEKAKSKCKVSFLVKRCWGSRKQETETKQTILRLKLCLNFCIALSIKKGKAYDLHNSLSKREKSSLHPQTIINVQFSTFNYKTR